MPIRLAACDPCRSSKLACDHVRPACSRCRESNRVSKCIYRERPFKRGKTLNGQHAQQVNSTRLGASIGRVRTTFRNYPNPGYLGSSSHATIFGHLPTGNDDESENPAQDPDETAHTIPINDAQISHGADLIAEFQSLLSLVSCKALIEQWTGSGVNLALAEPFTKHCAETIEHMLRCSTGYAPSHKTISRNFFTQSWRPLAANANTTLEDFCAEFSYGNARWETIGLFFTAASRASIETLPFDALYSTKKEQRYFQKLAMLFSDQCLDIALSLDCLNDLQLILQYENFILHSIVDGDQSKPTFIVVCCSF